MRPLTTTFTAVLLLLPLLLTAQTRQWQWVERGGGDGFNQDNEREKGVDIALDNNNDVYVCGQTFPLATFSGTNLGFNFTDINIFLAKYNCEGGLAWVKGFGSAEEDFANSVVTDEQNNVYITGKIYKSQSGIAILGDDTLTDFGELYVSKFDSAGNHLWNKISYTFGTVGHYIDIGPKGHLYIYGDASSKRTKLFGKYDVGGGLAGPPFLMKMSRDGAIHWVKNLGDTSTYKSYPKVEDMSVGASGNIYLAGTHTHDTLFFFSETIVRKSNHSDIIVSKFDSSGQFEWVRRAGSSQGLQRANDIAVAGDSAVYVTGEFLANNQDADFGNIVITKNLGAASAPFLARYNPDGSVKWVQVPNQCDNCSGKAVDVSSNGSVHWAGMFINVMEIDNYSYQDPTTSGFSTFITQTSPKGKLKEGDIAGEPGGAGDVFPRAIAAGYHNNVVFTGTFEERVVINGDTTNNTGGGDWDIITAKYGSDNCSIPQDTGTGLRMKTYRTLDIWPNPVSGNNATLRLSRSLEQPATARLISNTGRTVWQGELPRGSRTIKPEKEIAAGLYILELQTESAKYSAKVVVAGDR